MYYYFYTVKLVNIIRTVKIVRLISIEKIL